MNEQRLGQPMMMQDKNMMQKCMGMMSDQNRTPAPATKSQTTNKTDHTKHHPAQ
jgi:hypothetical protein